MTPDQIARLAALGNALRPDWPIGSLRTFIERNLGARGYGDVAVALAWVGARRPETATPRLLLEAGPWWQAAVAADGQTTANHPPKPGQDCPRHPGQWADRCGGCAADKRAADGADTPPRAWEPATTDAAALARAAYAQSRANLCAHGVPRLNCADHRDAPEAEEGEE